MGTRKKDLGLVFQARGIQFELICWLSHPSGWGGFPGRPRSPVPGKPVFQYCASHILLRGPPLIMRCVADASLLVNCQVYTLSLQASSLVSDVPLAPCRRWLCFASHVDGPFWRPWCHIWLQEFQLNLLAWASSRFFMCPCQVSSSVRKSESIIKLCRCGR